MIGPFGCDVGVYLGSAKFGVPEKGGIAYDIVRPLPGTLFGKYDEQLAKSATRPHNRDERLSSTW